MKIILSPRRLGVCRNVRRGANKLTDKFPARGQVYQLLLQLADCPSIAQSRNSGRRLTCSTQRSLWFVPGFLVTIVVEEAAPEQDPLLVLFCFPLLIIIPPSLDTHLSPPLEMCDSLDNAERYHVFSL
jgi:hypothetical protein